MDLFDFEDVAANYDHFVTALGSDPESLVDFHLDLARRFGRQGVLDVACGTGATMVPLLQAGFEVTGVDLSPAMIDQAGRKLAGLPQAARARGRLLCANMTDFDAGTRSSLAVIPQSGFMHLLTSEEQEQALRNLNRHLLDGGVLAFNTFDPDYRQIAENGPDRAEPRKFLRVEYTNARGRRERIWNALRHDWSQQIVEGIWTFEELGEGGEILGTRERPVRMRWSFEPEIRYLLRLTGFEPVATYRSYRREPRSYGGPIIWVARKVGSPPAPPPAQSR